MTKSLSTIFMTIVMSAFLLISAMAFTASVAEAQTIKTNDNLCNGILATASDGVGCDNTGNADSTINNIIKTVINIFSLIIGAIAVIMIIVGGLRYITSSGDSANVQAAKNTILYAIVGIIVVVFAQTIVRFVIAKATE